MQQSLYAFNENVDKIVGTACWQRDTAAALAFQLNKPLEQTRTQRQIQILSKLVKLLVSDLILGLIPASASSIARRKAHEIEFNVAPNKQQGFLNERLVIPEIVLVGLELGSQHILQINILFGVGELLKTFIVWHKLLLFQLDKLAKIWLLARQIQIQISIFFHVLNRVF